MLITKHNRCARALQKRLLLRRDMAERFCRLQVAAQHRKRLFGAMFAPAQPLHGIRVAGIARQMNPACSLDCNNLSCRQRLLGQGDRLSLLRASRGVQKICLRAADRAAIRLGMVAAAFNVGIFGRTGRAHGKACH